MIEEEFTRFPSKEDAQKAGWFSRSHRTDEAYQERTQRFREHHAARKANAKIRQEHRNKRAASEQLKLLDQRLGKGVGARKERAILTARLTA